MKMRAARKAVAGKNPAKKVRSAAGHSRQQASRSAAGDVNALWQLKWPEIVANAWADAGFRQRLLADPQGVLREYGLPTVEGLNYRVVEGSEKFELSLPLPPAPALEESSMKPEDNLRPPRNEGGAFTV